ncbi:ABC1 kinase family protein [Halorarius halobius]|uniref:ABC1 kinase family protein n=1 Tax=Halorarius halobius TaxID=2962671 RepID=UPI0020CCF303|nr:AarF/ABC1/UbiB kinase family protein [Halorarius halobius]
MARTGSEVETVEPNRWRTVVRFVAVVRAFLPLVVAYARDRNRFLLVGRSRQVDEETTRERARYLRETLVRLGPTFIKVGQILSTRPDVVGPAYIEELSQLQDRVPPADWEEIRPVVEAELGPVDEVYDEFDTEPISGASLGQVYTAVADGERVAVKVLRPNIRERVETDLVVVRTLLPVLVRFAPRGQAFTLRNLAEEFTATLRGEMDYDHEARLLEAVRANFRDDPAVRMPAVRSAYSTDRVLTMEYVEGTKITDVDDLEAMGLDRTELVETLTETYFQMIVEDGTFHADPHPGNLAVQPDGTVVFYDFGVVGTLGPDRREQIVEMYLGLAADDTDRVIDAFVRMGALDPAADRDLIREVFDLVFEQLRGRQFERAEIQAYVREFQGAMQEVPFRLPQDLALIVRVSTVLEGVTRTLDPDYDFIEAVTEYVEREGYREAGGAVSAEIEAQATAAAEGLFEVPPALERILDATQRGDGVLVAAFRANPAVLTTFAWRMLLALFAGLGITATTALYVLGLPTAALGTAGGSAVVVLALAYSFRSRSNRGVRQSARMAQRSLGERRR